MYSLRATQSKLRCLLSEPKLCLSLAILYAASYVFAYSASNRSNSIGMSINMRAELAAPSSARYRRQQSCRIALRLGRDKTEKRVGEQQVPGATEKARSPEIESDKFNARGKLFPRLLLSLFRVCVCVWGAFRANDLFHSKNETL